MMSTTKLKYLLGICLLIPACDKDNNNISEGKYDPEYECEQEAKCAEEEGEELSQEEIDQCVEDYTLSYESSDETRKDFDAAWEICKNKTSCDYLDCFEANY